MGYPRRRINDDDGDDERRYPVNPDQRRTLKELDEQGKEWWPTGGGCYETNNSTILPDGREYKDM